MNFAHLASLVGLLKIAALVSCIIAAVIGSNAYFLSEYNSRCRDGTADKFEVPTTTVSSTDTGSPSEPTGPTTLRTRPPVLPNQETTGFPGSSDDTGAPSSTENIAEYKDMAPVLWMERFQWQCCWIAAFGLLVLLIPCVIREDVEYNKIFKAVNFGFHFIFSVLLLISAIFIAFAAYEIDRQVCQHNFADKEECQKYKLKMSAAAVTFLTSVLYGVVCTKILCAHKLYEEVV